MLRLDDHWIWDSWIADDGERYHLFFLQAPRALGDPRLRHTAAVIGHASSADLVGWEYHGVAFEAASGGWDDLAVWTGSVARGDDDIWRMYYTALSTRGHGIKDQRLGLAESGDLHTWRRVGDAPVLEIDGARYRTLAGGPGVSETWRDPFVFRDGDGWRMLVTARDPRAPRFDDGVLALARSEDMLTWELDDPVSAPGAGFGQIEVPQLRVIDGQPLLVFTCEPEEQSEARRSEHGAFSTWYVLGEAPWDLTRARPFTPEPELFAAPLVQRRDGSWAFLGFRHEKPEGISFEIIDPIGVELEGGSLERSAS